MKFHLGENPEVPVLSATLSNEELAASGRQDYFEETLTTLKAERNLSITKDGDMQTMQFLLHKLGRRPENVHDEQLTPIINMLDWLSLREPEPDDTIKSLIIGTDRVSDRLPLGVILQWPDAPEGKVGAFATGVMRQIGRDLKYDKKFQGTRGYEIAVYSWLNRSDPEFIRGVSVQSDPVASAGIETIGDEFEPAEPNFRLECHNIYSYKQLLICFAGAVAIARADEIL